MTRTSSADAAAPTTESDAAATRDRAAARRVALARRLLGRVIGAAVTLFGAASLAFLAQLALPGDRATVIYNIRAGQAVERTPAELAQITTQYGLDHPLIVQYLDYVRGLFSGDLGLSYQQYRPVTAIIGEQLGPTLTLTVTALALAWLIMIAWVTLTAGRGPRVSAIGAVVDTVTAGLPHYWLGILLLLVFSLGLGWFPVISGSQPAGLFLPALTLAIPLAGFMGQATRAEFEKTLAQPFVVSARMRGMGDTAVRLRHVLRHSVLPAVTLSGWALGATISGAVIVEALFSRQGIGTVLIAAVGAQDLPIVTGVVVLIAALYVVANLLVDVAYTLIDPRLKTNDNA
ncbi:peptide/nickel transport system permease protein [Paramicrobacterium humi]|uniref:Peptide/nickel transport system permease protein n=1 Tax=Paramicrobacterium humi TaxID=640635 RepID=A0A1H4LHT8_9MICO|nr:ABC transporter permease [Microbacterium humi]SEB69872.1 peptide/nickel transport system permease protein [Microbacterium humi]